MQCEMAQQLHSRAVVHPLSVFIAASRRVLKEGSGLTCLVLLVCVAGVPLSRRAVGMAFPAFTSSLLSLRSILLFNRAKTQDKDVSELAPGAALFSRMFSCVPALL